LRDAQVRASANKARREVQRGTASLVPDFVGRLNLNRLQFARSYEVEDFSGAMFPGLQAKDFFYTSKGSKVTGSICYLGSKAHPLCFSGCVSAAT